MYHKLFSIHVFNHCLFLIAGVYGNLVMTQSPKSLSTSVGDRVSLSCKSCRNVDISVARHQQKPGQASKLLIYQHPLGTLGFLICSQAVSLGQISLSPLAVARLKSWLIITVFRVTPILPQCFSLQQTPPLRISPAPHTLPPETWKLVCLSHLCKTQEIVNEQMTFCNLWIRRS